MENFKKWLKNFFSSKINIAFVSVLVVFFVMVIIPCNEIWYAKIQMLLLAVFLLILAYKMYLKHKKNKEVYDILNTERKQSNNVFGKISDRYESYNQNTNLICAIALALIAIMIIVVIIFK